MAPGPVAPAACALRGLAADDKRAVGEPMEFSVQLRDTHGNARPAGADRVKVQLSGHSADASPCALRVTPLDGGVYACKGTPGGAGKLVVAPIMIVMTPTTVHCSMDTRRYSTLPRARARTRAEEEKSQATFSECCAHVHA